jgi:polyribonucleotide nucleotidyltransferase
MAIERKKYTIEVGGKELAFELSSLAEQANAAVLVRYGGTVVLATAVMSEKDAAADYLPLKVDYEERFYAAGKIIGSRFVRREGRPSEEAVLSGRLVDRTIRPLFDYRLRRDIQVIVTVVAYDEENDPDFVGLMGASAALALSDIPWQGPAAGVRVAHIGGKFVVNPTRRELASPDFSFETFAAGPKGKINMIELGGKEAKEDDILAAFAVAQKEVDRLIEFQEKCVAEIGKPKAAVAVAEGDAALKATVEGFLGSRLEEVVFQPLDRELGVERPKKTEREEGMRRLREELAAHLAATAPDADQKAVEHIVEEAIDRLVHVNALEKQRRPDGRRFDEIRPLTAEVGLFERTHGSAVFVRGTTQALAVTTLAAPGSEQLIETMETTGKRRFLLHYNFPPFSVGEVGRLGSPGRREIGHGALAEKAVRPLIPGADVFPYTIRVVSETLSSNGSSSMATVCAATLALMDAGVPLIKPVAGIAMGLMLEEPRKDADSTQNNAEGIQRESASGPRQSAPLKYQVLTDLQGYEDFYGDMDFKVAGTRDGVTAIQLDTKVRGLSLEIIKTTLADARKARLAILDMMQQVLAAPREKLSPHAPLVFSLKIDPEKIGLLIGPGGKVINGLIKKYELATIDVEEDGSVFVAGPEHEKAEAAVAEIKALTREIKVGEIVEGNIIKILDFGAIVDLGGGKDGMIHVSELRDGFVKNVTDVVKVGDFVRAKVIRAEDDRIGLSIKQLQK